MLASSGLTFGVRRTLPHIAGIIAGCFVLIAAAGLGLGALFAAAPQLQTILKVAGALYLLYLAFRLWRAGELKDSVDARPLSFWAAAAFQFVNPKALVMALTVVSAFTVAGEDYLVQLLLVCVVFSAVGLPCISSWAVFGATMRSLLRRPGAIVWFNRIMAALTVGTAALMFA
jgi:threonine/homoserine/homoserine lactone efflux protein